MTEHNSNAVSTSFREYSLVGAALALLLLIAFSRELIECFNLYVLYFFDRTPYFYSYPCEMLIRDELAIGMAPLWDNLRGLGEPTIMPILTTAFHPLRLPVYLLPLDLGLTVFVLLRLWTSGLGMYFAGRWFGLGRAGSATAAISYMLCGYFLEFMSFQDMNLYPLLPPIMGYWKKYTRSGSIFDLTMFALFVNLIGAVGHPEAIFFGLGLTLFSGWMIAIASQTAWKTRRMWMMACALIVGWPFISHFLEIGGFTEMWFHGWQYHTPGFGLVHYDVRSMPNMFHPFFKAAFDLTIKPNPYPNAIGASPNHIGLIATTLMLVALVYIRRVPRDVLHVSLILIPSMGILFGLPLFSDLTLLPILDVGHNHRYLQPLIALEIAFLAGTGTRILLGRINMRIAVVAAMIIMSLSLLAILSTMGGVGDVPIPGYGGIYLLLIALTLVFAFSFAAIFILLHGLIISRRTAAILLLILLGANLIVSKPFSGPSGIKEKSIEIGFERVRYDWATSTRIYATDSEILTPNFSSVYALNDIRDHSAIIPRNYADFVIALNRLETPREILEHFISSGWMLGISSEKLDAAWLDVLGVGKFLTWSEPGAVELFPDFYINADYYFTKRTQVKFIPTRVKEVTKKSIIFESPGRMEAEVKIPERARELVISSSGTVRTDPVCYIARIDESGRSKVLYSRCFAQDEAGWRESRIDVSEYMGREVNLILWNAPVRHPAANPALAAWGDGYIAFDKDLDGYKALANPNFRVYENTNALPLAFTIKGPPPEDPPESGTDIKRLVREGVSGIMPHGSGSMTIDVAPNPGDWIMITQVYYPGWKMYAVKADGTTHGRAAQPCVKGFTCAPLEEGDVQLRYTFDPPSLRIGFWALMVHYVFMAIAIVIALHLRRRINPDKESR